MWLLSAQAKDYQNVRSASLVHYYPLSDQRFSKTDANLIEQRFLHDGSGVIEELSSENETTRSYKDGPGIDEHLGMVVHDALNGDSVYAYVTDPLGTVRNVVNDTGAISNSYDYKAFGTIRSKTEGVSNPYLFTGRRWNMDIQEYYYRARNYMPDIGRFGAVDRYAPGEQTYGYAAMNPLMYRDPRGESITLFGLGLAFAKISLVGIFAGGGYFTGDWIGNTIKKLNEGTYNPECVGEDLMRLTSLVSSVGLAIAGVSSGGLLLLPPAALAMSEYFAVTRLSKDGVPTEDLVKREAVIVASIIVTAGMLKFVGHYQPIYDQRQAINSANYAQTTYNPKFSIL